MLRAIIGYFKSRKDLKVRQDRTGLRDLINSELASLCGEAAAVGATVGQDYVIVSACDHEQSMSCADCKRIEGLKTQIEKVKGIRLRFCGV